MSHIPTWVEVDLSAIAHNLAVVRKMTSPRARPATNLGGARILAVVKADAYGHGAVPVAKKLIECGVDYLAVASMEEAVQLREAGISASILVLGVVHPSEVKAALEMNVTLTLFTKTMLRALMDESRRQGKRPSVHIKVDTGMGRLGVWFEEALDFAAQTFSSGEIVIEGIFTHLAAADEDEAYTLEQLGHFNKIIAGLNERNIAIPYKHAANSMGILGYRDAHFNMVRPGLVLYGLYPDQKRHRAQELRAAMSFKSRIVWLKRTPKGRFVSYGRTHVTEKDTVLAALPVGYSHGYPRALSNKADVLIGGTRAPVAGRVCMDQMMVDVGHLVGTRPVRNGVSNGVKVGDEVCLLGAQGDDRITAEELAGICGTISYEIVCWISRRVPRIYIGEKG